MGLSARKRAGGEDGAWICCGGGYVGFWLWDNAMLLLILGGNWVCFG